MRVVCRDTTWAQSMDGAANGELGHFTYPSRQVSNPAAVHPYTEIREFSRER
jgi:hypothetical protein